mmetsp:Transcript_31106/g.101392  ORF Transcript_31106/g.101392 Transcript_31106/m.101392 type:complete len:264 (+) Transcript_31106:23-814(+)
MFIAQTQAWKVAAGHGMSAALCNVFLHDEAGEELPLAEIPPSWAPPWFLRDDSPARGLFPTFGAPSLAEAAARLAHERERSSAQQQRLSSLPLPSLAAVDSDDSEEDEYNDSLEGISMTHKTKPVVKADEVPTSSDESEAEEAAAEPLPPPPPPPKLRKAPVDWNTWKPENDVSDCSLSSSEDENGGKYSHWDSNLKASAPTELGSFGSGSASTMEEQIDALMASVKHRSERRRAREERRRKRDEREALARHAHRALVAAAAA